MAEKALAVRRLKEVEAQVLAFVYTWPRLPCPPTLVSPHLLTANRSRWNS